MDTREEYDERREVERAATFYYHTPLQTGIDNRTKRFVIGACLPHVKGPSVLELGYVDGLWTDALLQCGFCVDVVEGAQRHVEHARAKYAGNPAVRVHHEFFGSLAPARTYDTVLAGDMLRYVREPQRFLRAAKQWLAPGGVLIVTVPNSRSLHRRIGALMGMEADPAQANARDREVGNLRSYDRESLRETLTACGYQVRELRGCFLKPLSSAQMESWSDELLSAFAAMGEELQDYAWFLYAVCDR